MKGLNLQEISEAEKFFDQSFYKLNAVLEPVDLFEIVNLLEVFRPLIIKLVGDYGDQFISDKKKLEIINEVELPKLDSLIADLTRTLVSDYTASGSLEMMMLRPKDRKVIGLLDMPLGDSDPNKLKASLRGGRYQIIGKPLNFVGENDEMSLLDRSSLSQIPPLLRRLVSLSDDGALATYNDGIKAAKEVLEGLIRVSVQGPAARLIALSVNV